MYIFKTKTNHIFHFHICRVIWEYCNSLLRALKEEEILGNLEIYYVCLPHLKTNYYHFLTFCLHLASLALIKFVLIGY